MSKKTVDPDIPSDNVNQPIITSNHSLPGNTKMFILPPNVLQSISVVNGGSRVSAIELLKRDNSALSSIIAQGQNNYELSMPMSLSSAINSNAVVKPTAVTTVDRNKSGDDTDNKILTDTTKVPKVRRSKGRVKKSTEGALPSPKDLHNTKCTTDNEENSQTTSDDVPKPQEADTMSEQCSNDHLEMQEGTENKHKINENSLGRPKRIHKQSKLDDYITELKSEPRRKKSTTPNQRRKSIVKKTQKMILDTSVTDTFEADNIVNDIKTAEKEELQKVRNKKAETSTCITPALIKKSLPLASSKIAGDHSSIKDNEYNLSMMPEGTINIAELNIKNDNAESMGSINTSVLKHNKECDILETNLELQRSEDSNVKSINTNTRNQTPNIVSNSFNQETPATNSESLNHSKLSTPPVRKRGRPRKIIPVPQTPNTSSGMEQNLEDSQNEGVISIAETVAQSKRHSEKSYNIRSDVRLIDESNAGDSISVALVVRKRGRPMGSKNTGKGRGSGRGGGRGGGVSYSTLDTEYIPKLKGSIVKEEINQEIRNGVTDVSRRTDDVICAVCEAAVPRKQWNPHNLVKHNYMSWRKGDQPLDYENDIKLWRRLLVTALKKRKGILVCEKCGDVKRSVNGFISHMQFCGKSEDEKKALMVRCGFCSAIMMPSSLEIHERGHRQSEQSAVKEKEPIIIEAERTKRKAAEKAVSKILEFTEQVKRDSLHLEKKMKLEPSLLKNVIKPPAFKKNIPGIWKSRWKKELASQGTITCRQIGCTYTCTTFVDICEHFSECNFTPQECYLCKICKFTAITNEEIIKHVTDEHATPEGIDKCSDFEDEDNSSDENMSYRMNFLEKEQMYKLRWTDPYFPALHWTMEFEQKNYELHLFDEFTPNCFTLLNNIDGAEYLPELEVSMCTKQESTESNIKIQWKQWKRFEGGFAEGISTFFVGGPVWALAWLPIPAPLHSKQISQYIAISTHPTMESEYSIGKAYSGRNIIQIWNVGPLHYEIDTATKLPVLSYAIVHNSGTVWCLEWCPSGCYQDENLNNYKKESESQSSLKRMGMLAAACSDGNVHIYSLPFPEELEFQKTEENALPIYSTDPVITLVVNISIYEKNDQKWQCTKLSWTKEHGHSTIAAGFSNGYIALWDLTKKSPLTMQKRRNTYIINAFQHFYAHGNAVSMVTLVPYNGQRFLASGSVDRFFKFWNLENTTGTPQNCLHRGIIVNGAWMTHWPCAVVSFDDALGYKHTNTYLFPVREFEYKLYPVLATNSSTYGLAISDYANSIAHGTLAGEILSVFHHEFVQGKDLDKTSQKKRKLSSFIEVVDFLESESVNKEEKNVNENQNKDEKNSSEYHYMPETYNECKDRFGIVFHDRLKDHERFLQHHSLYPEKLADVQIEEYPFMSANRVEWNPNPWSYLWLVAGYQNGLVRLLNFKYMAIGNELKTSLSKHAKCMLDKANAVER